VKRLFFSLWNMTHTPPPPFPPSFHWCATRESKYRTHDCGLGTIGWVFWRSWIAGPAMESSFFLPMLVNFSFNFTQIYLFLLIIFLWSIFSIFNSPASIFYFLLRLGNTKTVSEVSMSRDMPCRPAILIELPYMTQSFPTILCKVSKCSCFCSMS
jgi:hypothetical protein